MSKKSICTNEITKSVCILIEKGMSMRKIADVLSTQVGKSALYNWLDKGHAAYNPAFAEAVRQAQERLDTGQVKLGQIEQAVKHKLKKVTRERRVIDIRTKDLKIKLDPPRMPPGHFTKKDIVKYARVMMDLKLDARLTISDMRMKCEKRIAELSEEIMEVTKEETTEVDPCQNAVKNVLTNMGTDDEKWSFKEEQDLNVKGDVIFNVKKNYDNTDTDGVSEPKK